MSRATTLSPYWRTSRAASPALMPWVNRNVSTSRIVATSRQATIARSTLLREIARPAFVRTSRSRSGSRSSSLKTCSAPKWSTIARAKVRPMPGTRVMSQSTMPSGDCGSADRKVVTPKRQPCRACSENEPVQTSWSPGVRCPSGPTSVTGSPSRSSPIVADHTANSVSAETYRGPDWESVTLSSEAPGSAGRPSVSVAHISPRRYSRGGGPPRRCGSPARVPLGSAELVDQIGDRVDDPRRTVREALGLGSRCVEPVRTSTVCMPASRPGDDVGVHAVADHRRASPSARRSRSAPSASSAGSACRRSTARRRSRG